MYLIETIISGYFLQTYYFYYKNSKKINTSYYHLLLHIFILHKYYLHSLN